MSDPHVPTPDELDSWASGPVKKRGLFRRRQSRGRGIRVGEGVGESASRASTLEASVGVEQDPALAKPSSPGSATVPKRISFAPGVLGATQIEEGVASGPTEPTVAPEDGSLEVRFPGAGDWTPARVRHLMALLSYDAQRFLELLATRAGQRMTEEDIVVGLSEDAWTPDMDQLIGNIARNAAWVGRNLEDPLTLPFTTWVGDGDEEAYWMPEVIAEGVRGTGWKRRASPRTT